MLFTLALAHAGSPYTPARAQNVITADELETVTLDDGSIVTRSVERRVDSDEYGNAQGNQYDLVRDGAFEGQTVAVLHFYTQEAFDFALPEAALAEKGFSVYRWAGAAPSVDELKAGLEKANQLWLISGSTRLLSDEHIAVIDAFFDEGHGVYIWGDNQPYYADANAVADALFGGSMEGNLSGGQSVTMKGGFDSRGFVPGHDITTGLENLFEGITIATLDPNQDLEPLVYGSAGNLVTATYERDGKRAVFDGGFTRLYCNWDTAGTARYVKNAAGWLANYERFGDDILADSTAE